MKKSFGNYRLIVKGGRLGGSLWEGPDHLLEIETSGFGLAFNETYRRIDYKNIQAISYCKTSWGKWLNALVVLLLVFFGWGALMNFNDDRPLWIFCSICFTAVLGVLIVNMVRGPTCRCKVQTAVQSRHLKQLDRLRKAKRFVDQITPLCMAHQQGMAAPQEDVPPELAGESLPARPSAPVISRPQTVPDIGGKQAWTGSKLVTWALILLVISGIATMVNVFVKGLPILLLDVSLGITAYVLAIAALARSRKYLLPWGLSFALKGAMVAFVLTIITGYGFVVWASIESTQERIASGGRPEFRGDQNYIVYERIAKATFEELGWASWVWFGVGALPAFLGLLGLPSALRPGNSQVATVPPPLPGAAVPAPSTAETPP